MKMITKKCIPLTQLGKVCRLDIYITIFHPLQLEIGYRFSYIRPFVFKDFYEKTFL